MKRSHRARRARTLLRVVALLLAALAFAPSCGNGPLPPFAGASEWMRMDFVSLPVGWVNVAGGNFLLPRADLSIDTRLGMQTFGATWNSASGAWRWSTDLTYDGTTFLDAAGSSHSVTNLQPGQAIPGTRWRLVDATHLKTKGGLVHGFGSDGLLEEVHWSGQPFPDLRYLYTAASGARQLVTVEQCTAGTSCTAVFSLAYDASGRLASVTGRAGRVAQYTYDASGELVAARDPAAIATGGSGIRYEYTNGQISAVIDGDDEEVDLTYDSAHRLTGLTQLGEENPSWGFSYFAVDSNGRYETSVTNPLGDVTSYYYDRGHRLLELRRPSGSTWSWTWSGQRVATATDARRVTTSYRYTDDDPVAITLPSGDVISMSYQPDAANRMDPGHTAVAAVSDSLGTILQATYDGAARLTAVTNGAGDTQSFTYDSLGNLATSTSPSGYTVTYGGYGEHGHPTSISTRFGTSTAIYDAVGDLLKGSSPQAPGFGTSLGGVVSRSFDADRRVQQEVLVATGGTTSTVQIDRRADGRPLAIHRPYGGETDFVYDALGRLIAQRELVDGAWQTTVITRDALGRPASVVRPNGMEVDRAWNGDGQLVSLSRLRNGSLEATASYTYAGGLLASVQDSMDGGTESYERDASGRPTAIHFASDETLQIQYDARERETQEIYSMPDSQTPLRTIGYTYDGANRRVDFLDGGKPIVTHMFSQGRISSIGYGNGLTRSFGYDPTSNFVDMVQTQDASGNTVESTQVTWGTFPALAVEWKQTLPVSSQDEVYLLLSAYGDQSGLRAEDGILFDYDALSNLTHGVLSTPSSTQSFDFTYNGEHNRLLSTRDSSTGNPIHTYDYDAAGFVTQRDGVAISWTADGRLSSVGSAAQLSWDLEGRIVSMDIAGQTTRFLFGGRVEADASGTPQKLLLGEAEIDLTTGNRFYRHYDFRGNVSFVTDSSGSVVQAYDYSDYGVRASFGPVQGERSFAQGRLLSDLVLMGGRLYDSSTARFLSPDPIFQLENQYAYAMGNPIQFWDPGATSAHSALAVALGVVTVVGAIAAIVVGGPIGLAVAVVTLSADAGIVSGATNPKAATSDTTLGAEGVAAAIVAAPAPEFEPVIGAFVGGQLLGAGLVGTGGSGAPPAGALSGPAIHGDVAPPSAPGRGCDCILHGPSGRVPPPGASLAVGGGSSGGGGGPGGGGGGGGGGCTATALSRPGPALAWLWLLGPLQVGLGAWLLRAARATGPRQRRDQE